MNDKTVWVVKYVRVWNKWEQDSEIVGVFDDLEQANQAIKRSLNVIPNWEINDFHGVAMAGSPFESRWFAQRQVIGQLKKPEYYEDKND